MQAAYVCCNIQAEGLFTSVTLSRPGDDVFNLFHKVLFITPVNRYPQNFPTWRAFRSSRKVAMLILPVKETRGKTPRIRQI